MANNPGKKQTVAVIFGSRSVEHDVSIVTAQQVIKALDPARYEAVPVYITRDGRWLTGAPLAELSTFKNENVSEIIGVKESGIQPGVKSQRSIVILTLMSVLIQTQRGQRCGRG